MSARVRSMLEQVPAYVPGRSIPGAVKLASNETSYPLLPHVVERVAEAAAGANRYPDFTSTRLTAAIAEHLDVDAALVRVGCGSISLVAQLVQAVADIGDEVVYAWRSFEAYPIVTAVRGATSVQVPLTPGHAHDLDAMLAAITDRTRLVIVCNPNNPTGTAVTDDSLRRFLAAVPTETVVALDEAYLEFVTDPDVPDGLTLLADFPNLVVTRSFSKAYGLAGLRVGYAVAADPAIAMALGQTQVPFSVSSVAQVAALASLEAPAQQQMLERVASVVSERERTRQALLDYGYDVPPSQGNFVWLALGEHALAWAARCEDEHGVITRAFAGAGVRVTIGLPEENDRLLAAARPAVGMLVPRAHESVSA